MWFTRLFWKLLFAGLGLVAVLTVSGLWLALAEQESQAEAQARLRLRDTAILYREQLPSDWQEKDGTELAAKFAAALEQAETELSVRKLDPDETPPAFDYAIERGPDAGAQRMIYRLPIPAQGEPHGYVVAAIAWEEAPAALAASRRWVWTFAIAGAAASLIVVWLAVRHSAGPLARLAADAQAVAASGDEQLVEVEVESQDELGQLGDAFNDMQRKLHQRVGQLRENSERLHTVLGSMVEGVIAVDAQQRIVLANDAGRSLLEFVTADVIGRPLLEVTRSRAVHDAVLRAFASPAPAQTEFEAPGASRRVLLLRAARLPGEPCPGVVVVLHDVSELRRLENLRRELVANVSHELKTPLASIKAYAETLRLGAINDPEHNLAFVARIEEQAERLHQLILDLLHIARIEAGHEALEIVAIPVAMAVEQCVAQHAGKAASRRIALVVEPPPQPLAVRADEEGLRTILSNLVDNALKYTPEDGRVTLRWRQEHGQVAIEVQDNGIGIAPQDQARVFERFYRVDRARSRELGGTGLGLSIVKHLTQAMQGTVSLTSKLRAGSTFRITLPLAN